MVMGGESPILSEQGERKQLNCGGGWPEGSKRWPYWLGRRASGLAKSDSLSGRIGKDRRGRSGEYG